MEHTTPLYIKDSADEYISGYTRIFDSMEFESFIPNAWMSDRFY